jgi:hypothetical protein
MSYRGTLEFVLTGSFDTTTLALSDLSDTDLLVGAVPGATHIAWRLGQVLMRESRMLGWQDLGVNYPEFPAGFEEQHSGATAHMEQPCGFLSKLEYLDLYAKVHSTTMAGLAGLSNADLDRPVKGEGKQGARTLGELHGQHNRNNQGHTAQFALVRLKLSKPSVI